MSRLSIILHKKWLFLLLAIGLVVTTTLAVLPLVIQRVAVAWLEENGADQAVIGNIDLNIFTGRLNIFDVEVEKEGQVSLRIWRFTTDVDLWHLLRKRIFVREIWLYEADFVITQLDDGSLEVGGISLAPAAQTDIGQEADTGESRFLDNWGVGLDSFAIKNSSIRYQSSNFDEQVDINSFYVLNIFSWQPEEPARISFNIMVNQQPVIMRSDARVFRDAPDTQSTLQITKLDLSRYQQIAKQAGIDEIKGLLSVSVTLDAVYQTDKKAYFTFESDINLSDFLLRQNDLLLEYKSLSYQGDAKINLPVSEGEQLATTKGQLIIQDHTTTIEGLRANYSELKWNGNFVVTKSDEVDAPPNTLLKGSLDVVNLQVDDEKNNLKLVSAKNISAGDISVAAFNEVHVGKLVIKDLKALRQSEVAKNMALPEIDLRQGVFNDTQFKNDAQTASVAGIELTDLSAYSADKKLQLAHVPTLNVEQAAVKLQESISVKKVTVKEAQALKVIAAADSPDLDPTVQANLTQLESIRYQFEPQTFTLQSIDIDGLNLLAKREADGSLYAVNMLATDGTDAPVEVQPKPSENDAAAPLLFKIENARIGNDSKIRIIDQSVIPNFIANVSPLNVAVEEIDNINLSTRTKIDINTSLNPGNRITANGWLTPFAAQRDADITLEISALDLVMFSPYAVKAAGYKVRSGRVNTSLKGKIDKDVVNAKTKIIAQRLNLDATSDAARGQSAQRLGIGMPIDAALALMKDKKGDIIVEVPVTGNLQDPNFAFGPAFRGALTQAVKKASVTYAAYAIQPYGSILIGAKMLNMATALRLESIGFESGEFELDDRAQKYLEKIAGLMNDRPGINITLCGIATDSDRKILRERNVNKLGEELVSLAEQRGDIVKEHLINKYSISADRFFDCQPEVTSDELAQPEVKLGL